MKCDPRPEAGDSEPIRFIEWKAILAKEALPPDQRDLFRNAILHFLRYCKTSHQPASVASIKIFLRNGKQESDRTALRWFFKASRRAPAAQLDIAPSGSKPAEIELSVDLSPPRQSLMALHTNSTA